MAARVKWFLDSQHANYEVRTHRHTSSSAETAAAAQVPADQFAKCVLLEDERGYVIAVLPSSRRIQLKLLREQLHRKLTLATEEEFGQLFPDCEVGAIPPLGAAYGVPTLIDDTLLHQGHVYFEAGDHEALICMGGAQFLNLLASSRHGNFTAGR